MKHSASSSLASLFPPRITQVLAMEPQEQMLEVSGWLRTRRDSGSRSFLELSDGSSLQNLQVLVEDSLEGRQTLQRQLNTGAALRVRGRLLPSPAKGQRLELRAEAITILGEADSASYPLQKKRHSFEFLRTITHLRSRTNALGAVARIRNTLSFAIHRFFQEQGFIQVHTPIITTSDCEGAGEMFTVTTLAAGTGTDPDYSRDFFGRHAGLTVSGQLQAEVYALSHSRVYTFGPTFRAENSNTTRHLAEFWMVEPEMAFCDLEGNMRVAEDLLRFVTSALLKENEADLALFERHIEQGLVHKLSQLETQEFRRLTYSEAISALEQSGRNFTFPVHWGMDLQAEHERYLCEELMQGPLFITNYPAALKPFYMRLDEGEKTVAAMDLLVPGIGELIGGSQREERLDLLQARMQAAGLDLAQYGWYLDLRRYGSVPHAGFGLGFERLVQFCTGMQNIREAILFPRSPGQAPC
ncbi:MAG: asparagine--tRNA ligase [bacterium]|nr:asparagine--tRNA ligase [bacterium]